MTKGKKGRLSFSSLTNLVTGRYRHWKAEHIPVLRLIVQRTGELQPAERSVLFSIVSAANSIVGLLVGPEAGKDRILRIDARKLTQGNFFSVYFDLVATLLAVFIQRGRLAKADGIVLENALAHLFHHDPRRDEFYCTLSNRLAEGGRSSAFRHLLRKIKETVDEPPLTTPADLDQWPLFEKVMSSGIEEMLELMLLNTEEDEYKSKVVAAVDQEHEGSFLQERKQALRKIKERVDMLAGKDYQFAQRILIASAEIMEKMLEFPGLKFDADKMTSSQFLLAYKWILAQLSFTFFARNPQARASAAALVTGLTDDDHIETNGLWWDLEQCLKLQAEGDIRSFTAEVVSQRIIRAFGGKEEAGWHSGPLFRWPLGCHVPRSTI